MTSEEMGIRDFIKDTRLNREQLFKGALIPKAEVKYQFQLGKPLVKTEQVKTLPTQMY